MYNSVAMAYPGYLTIELIRAELQDQTPGDNSIDCDLFFSDEQILHAMDRCAAKYNGMAPLDVDVVHPEHLPANTDVFMNGVLYYLYSSAINKLSRNVMTWQTGNTTVDLEGTRIKLFSSLKDYYEKEFIQSAKDRKMEINRSMGWGYM